MSTESYAKWWIKAKKGLEDLVEYDQTFLTGIKIKDRCLASKLIGGLYAKYCMVVKELTACLDQMCQIQKSISAKKLIDAAVQRLNELKDEMLKIDISEYHYIDGALIELKLIPHSIEILCPDFIYARPPELEELWIRIKAGEIIYVPPPPPPPEEKPEEETTGPTDPLAALFAKPKKEEPKPVTPPPPPPEESKEVEPPKEEEKKEEEVHLSGKKKHKKKAKKAFVLELPELTEEEIEAERKHALIATAITVIQTAERARQARLYYFDINRSKAAKQLSAPGAKQVPVDLDECEIAVVNIQRIWRGYVVRKFLARRENERRLIIGMTEPSWKSYDEFDKFEKNLEKRRTLRDQHIKDYIKAHLDEKARVLKVIGPGLFEDITEEVRYYLYSWYNTVGILPPIPTIEEGGTVIVIRGDTITIPEYLENLKKKPPKPKTKEEIMKEKAIAAAKKKKEKEAAKKAERLAKEAAKEPKKRKPFEVEITETDAIKKYHAAFQEYAELWTDVKELDNPTESVYMKPINDEKCHQMQMEIRAQVDEMMRLELQILQLALLKDRWLVKSKGKGTFKPPKAKKGKKNKGKKEKIQRNPLFNRCIEDMFQELVNNGIIHTYQSGARIRDYKGDFSYQNFDKRERLFDPPATLGDVRQAVVLNCIQPMGANSMLNKPRSVLIAGPRQSGKHLLANAIFNETKCVLFDLSAPVIADKYAGDKKETNAMIFLINRVSRILQPSVIFIDGAEKAFYRKVPKEEKDLNPKRVGKFLFKNIVKAILPEDKVLVLGISGKPWEAKAAMKKCFERIIMIPPTDYGSAYLYWNELLMPYHGIDRNLDISSLTELSQKYPLSEIKRAVLDVLIPRRIAQLKYKPLEQLELLSVLMVGPGPINEEEEAKFQKWYSKTRIGKERAVVNLKNEKLRRGLPEP